MSLGREAIMDALHERLLTRIGRTTFRTEGRRTKHWGDVPPESQPAIFTALGAQNGTYPAVMAPAIWTITGVVTIYARRDGVQPKIGDLIDGVESALRDPFDTPEGRPTTLDGKVQFARVAGVETDEGVLDEQAVAVVSIEIRVGG